MKLDARTIRSYGHGLAWKLLSLASKLGFVVVVLPLLNDGVFAEFAFVSSVALFAAIILSLGSFDAIPTYVRGRTEVRDRYGPLVALAFAATCAVFAMYFLGGGLWALGAGAAGVSLAHFVLGGIIRSTNPSTFEHVSNAPSILFLIFAVLLPARTVDDLLILFILANIPVIAGGIWYVGLPVTPQRGTLRLLRSLFAKLLVDGNEKSLSNVIMLLDFRALIVLPPLFGRGVPSDVVAVALTVGEALWQLGMVIVNRNYARYCGGGGSLRSSADLGLLLLAAMALAGAFLIAVPLPIEIKRWDWQMIGWALVFFSSMIGLLELRAFLWSRGGYARPVFVVGIAIALIQAVVVLAAPPSSWLQLAAMLLATGALGVLLLARKRWSLQ